MLSKRERERERRINQVFAREFDFDLEKFEKDKEKKFFEIGFLSISKNNLIRLSPRYFNIENKLEDEVWVPINHIFNLSGGKRVPKGEKFSDEETDYFYLRPNEVDIWGIDKDSIPFLSAEIYNQLKRYKIVSGELCVSIVGTIGKTALINTDDLEIGKTNLILSENFIKLAPIQEIVGLFYFYYFYSFIFKMQVNREYTIKPTQKLGIDKWKYIKVPNISLLEQEKIVNEIKNELDGLEKIKKDIKDKRNKINEIVDDYLKNIKINL